jgi:hypothetical protein
LKHSKIMKLNTYLKKTDFNLNDFKNDYTDDMPIRQLMEKYSIKSTYSIYKIIKENNLKRFDEIDKPKTFTDFIDKTEEETEDEDDLIIYTTKKKEDFKITPAQNELIRIIKIKLKYLRGKRHNILKHIIEMVEIGINIKIIDDIFNTVLRRKIINDRDLDQLIKAK